MTQKKRSWLIALGLYLGFLAVVGRLFYWQVIKSESLQAIAQNQYQRTLAFSGERGSISTADGFLLVGNRPVYRVFATPSDVPDREEAAALIAPILAEERLKDLKASKQRELARQGLESTKAPDLELDVDPENQSATSTSQADISPVASEAPSSKPPETLEDLTSTIEDYLLERLDNLDRTWVQLAPKVSRETRDAIAKLSINGIGFDEYLVRTYPEGKLASSIVGFVGKDEYGEDTGYFGLEGGLDNELKKRHFQTRVDAGLFGFQLFTARSNASGIDGRDVTLSIRRDIQNLVENELSRGMSHYGAKSGEVVIIDPRTGKILAMASSPAYSPEYFYEYSPELYRSPVVSHLFEPGSTFKPLTLAAGIDAGVITPTTKCSRCDSSRRIAGYTIRTWNNQYQPEIDMTEALVKSDNVAMVFVAEELGTDRFREYLEAFGFGQPTTDELQEDRTTPMPSRWGPVELATRSFGQGVSVTSLQLTRAIGAIANQGVMMNTSIVSEFYDPIANISYQVEPSVFGQPISEATAKSLTTMMVESAQSGEAQWTASRTHTIAAKTGTAQIAKDGRYDPTKTIATYVGFAPAHQPKYVMLVKLIEPGSSPWAAETAAPLWYDIAHQLHLLLNIPPDKLADPL